LDESRSPEPVSIPAIGRMTSSLFEQFADITNLERGKYPDGNYFHLHFDNAVVNAATHLMGSAVSRILVVSGSVPVNDFEKTACEAEDVVKKALEEFFKNRMKGDYCILDVPPSIGDSS